MKFWLRRIGGIYHLLAKQGAYTNIEFLADFRKIKKADDNLHKGQHLFLV